MTCDGHAQQVAEQAQSCMEAWSGLPGKPVETCITSLSAEAGGQRRVCNKIHLYSQVCMPDLESKHAARIGP